MRTHRLLAAALTLMVLGPVGPASADPAAPGPRVLDREVTATPTGELATETVALTGDGGTRDGAGPRSTGEVPAGWSTEVDVAPGTQMLGLSWTGPEAAEVEVRTRTGDGPWSEWIDMHPDASGDGGGDGARVGAGPAWLGDEGVDRIEVRVASGAVADLRLDAMTHTVDEAAARSADGTPRSTVDQPATAAGGPPIHLRSAWAPGGWQGWRSGCTPAPVVMDQLRFAVVHHTVSSNSYSAAAVPGLLAGMYRFHTETNGWCDIAYSFFVDRFGRVWQGRSGDPHSPILGGHARGFNTHSVGVALLGQHQPGASPAAVTPPAAALTAVRDLLAWKLAAHNVNPQATIPIVSQGSPKFPAGRTVQLPAVQGHRDSGQTACPGDLAHSRLAQIRNDVAARIAATRNPGLWAPATTGPAFFGRLANDAAGRTLPNGLPGRNTSLVVRGGRARDNLAYDIVFAGGTDVRIGSVDRLYRAAFTRWPDGPGMRFWVGQRDAGRSVMSLALSFTGSSEFRARYDHLGDAAFVDAIYRNVLGRAADQAGSDYWRGRLASGTGRHEVLAHFSESGEHKMRTNRQSGISRAYYGMLKRAPLPSDRDFWMAELAAGRTGLHMVRAILRSSEYARGA